MKIAACLLIALLFATNARGEDYEFHIRRLAAGTADELTGVSYKALCQGGLPSIAVLVAHLDDESPANMKVLLGDVYVSDGYVLTIGSVAFNALQHQLEGAWPKGFREFHVLTPENVASWLKAREGKSLAELRRDARAESLRRARAKLAANPSTEWLQEAVDFLSREYDE